MREADKVNAELKIAQRAQSIFGIFEGDLADFIAGAGTPGGAEEGAWRLVKDALVVADLLASVNQHGPFREDTDRDAAVLIWRLLMAADAAHGLGIREGSSNE